MNALGTIYRHSLALLTDLYQLTMAYAYWRSEMHTREAVFHLFYRRNPFEGGLALACGLGTVVEFLEGLRFAEEDVAYLAGLTGADGQPLFEPAFLRYLLDLHLAVDVDAMPEGTVCFAHEPLVRVRGPVIACQLLETALLNIVNFQTLVATKAARVCRAAQDDRVVEFGLRRAQGIDGGLAASRAAYIGGCHATSNVLAGKLFGIPVQGTHAHSWVMCFDDERSAFQTYAQALPNNCVFLVDTYDTLAGVRHAIEVGCWLKQQGQELLGIRLDSGDLAELSIAARRLLDEAGFKSTRIIASNDLDERLIESLKHQGATITVWGVGTRLVTAYDQPALGGVYKLGAIREPGGAWQYRIKLSEQAIKVNNPGVLQVRRFQRHGQAMGDMLYDQEIGATPPNGMTVTSVHLADISRRQDFERDTPYADLLTPIFRQGTRVYDPPTPSAAREHAQAQLLQFAAAVQRFDNPQEYAVGLESRLHDLKLQLVRQAREGR